jgi:hypothetical protein
MSQRRGLSILLLLIFLASISQTFAGSPRILRIAVPREGELTLDGVPTSFDALGPALREMAKSNGEVWYYDEGGKDEPQSNSLKVLSALSKYHVPLRVSTKSDFSDLIKSKENFEIKWIIDLATVLIATCALVATFWQILTTRRHNKLSVKPLLTFDRHYSRSKDVNVGLHVLNCGVGPAIIESTSVVCGPKDMRATTVDELFEILQKYGIDGPVRYYWYSPGDVIPPNKDQHYITLLRDAGSRPENFTKFLDDIEIVIEYSSIYGERFVLRNSGLRAD